MMQDQPQKPIIVTLPKDQNQQNKELQGLSDVLIGSLGLTGLFVLGALVLGVLMAVLMFRLRSRQPYDHFH
jgi:ABC-type phosphate transport system permease subunit